MKNVWMFLVILVLSGVTVQADHKVSHSSIVNGRPTTTTLAVDDRATTTLTMAGLESLESQGAITPARAEMLKKRHVKLESSDDLEIWAEEFELTLELQDLEWEAKALTKQKLVNKYLQKRVKVVGKIEE